MRLTGRVAIITGGGGGIGRGIAEVFGGEGAAVVVAGRTRTTLDATVAAIDAGGGRGLAVLCDVNDRSQVDAVVHAAVEAFGPPDILVNNAQGGGAGMSGPLEATVDDVFLTAYRGGLLSSLYGMQAVFPHMKDRGGSIVNMASATGLQGDPGFAAYGTTKEAIRGLTRHAAREWGRYGIRVNAVAPAALSDGAAAYRDQDPQRFEGIVKKIPLRYMAEVADIGRNVLGLVTDLDYLTGATLALDGGLVSMR